jgi:hypothetical protein
VKSYIKLYGPPIVKGLKALEKIAIDMPKVCIMNTPIELVLGYPGGVTPSGFSMTDEVVSYFGGGISEERCGTIISKSGESMGAYDFYFEWFKKPGLEELNNLIEQIDETFMKIGVKYSITTK